MTKLETDAIHSGLIPEENLQALSLPPISTGVSYKLPAFGSKLFEALLLENDHAAHVYSRWSNPTVRVLEERMAALEGAPAAVAVASGIAAISALVFTFLSAGDHIITNEVSYSGAVELFAIHLPRFGIEVSLVDTSDLDQVQDAVRPNTKLIYIETPVNPLMKIVDIGACAAIAHAAGAKLAVDSTFATPVLQHPMDLSADFVIHSMTKYLNGHGDALGGVILGNGEDILRIRRDMLVHLGGALSPFNAYLILRGLATLQLRMEKHCSSAALIANFLESHPKVERVFYPGLASHPQQSLANSQMTGMGGMIAFRLKGGLGAAITLAEKVKVFSYATSLGHPESLLFYYPTDIYFDSATYYSTEQKARLREWSGDGLMRVSVGLEDVETLQKDLDQALRRRYWKGAAGTLIYPLVKKSLAAK
jgi:methionine-gamma-lyase